MSCVGKVGEDMFIGTPDAMVQYTPDKVKGQNRRAHAHESIVGTWKKKAIRRTPGAGKEGGRKGKKRKGEREKESR